MSSLMLTVLLQASTFAAAPAPSTAYAEAYHESRQQGRPLMILVGADWCPACQRMKGAVIPDLQRRGQLADVKFAHVNTDRESQLARKLMTGGSIPQLILYYKTAEGWKKMQVVGAVSSSRLEAMIQRSVAESVGPLKVQMATIASEE